MDIANEVIVAKATIFEDLGYKPHAGQQRVHESAKRFRVLACGVRWGKSLCAGMEALAAALAPKERSWGWVVAPTYELTDKVMREAVHVAQTKMKHRVIRWAEREKVLKIRNLGGGVSVLQGKSADNPVSLLGEGLDYVVCDEASRFTPLVWTNYISQRLIDKKGWALMISSPKGKGWFYDAWKRGQGGDADYESWNCPSWDNPHLSREVIEAERARVPDRVFRQEYGAEFIEGDGQVFRSVNEAFAEETRREPVPGARYVGGLDLAKVDDYTVLTILDEGRNVVFWDRFRRVPWDALIVRIRAATARYNDARLLVDSTGVGEPIYDRLRGEGIVVKPYPFSSASKHELINNLSLMFEQRLLKVSREWTEAREELEAYQFDVTDSGTVRMSAPSGAHDDCVISLGLAAWQLRPARRALVAFA